jgi:hypothetical protein
MRFSWGIPKEGWCLYTAIFGEREHRVDAGWSRFGVPIFCFSNRTDLDLAGSLLRPAPAMFSDPNRSAKLFKILPHLFLPEFPVSVWFDAAIIPKQVNLSRLVREALTTSDLALHRHPERSCIYEEIEVCCEQTRDSRIVLQSQANHYRSLGIPPHDGLFAAGFLIRRHNSPIMQQLAVRWWNEIAKFSRRDQISLPVVLRELNTHPTELPGSYWDNKIFIYGPHGGKEVLNW